LGRPKDRGFERGLHVADAERGQRGDAQVSDECPIDDEEQRLGDQRAERRHCEPQNVAAQAPRRGGFGHL